MNDTIAAEPLASIYDGIWARGKAALATGTIALDPLPVDGTMRWGISAVFRHRTWSDALRRCADELACVLGDGHAIYGPDALHITLRQFEGFRAEVAADDASVRAYAAALASAVADFGPVRLDLRGLAASSAGVVVQGWPVDDLRGLRVDLDERLRASGPLPRGPEADRLRDSAHASLAIYGGPVDDTAALTAFVERHRTTALGACTFDEVSIVGYRRTRHAVTLIEYGVHRFDGVR